MANELCEAKTPREFADEFWIKPENVRWDFRHYIPVKYEDSITRRNQIRKYGVRYIEIQKLKRFIPNDIILDRANEIKAMN